MNIEYKFPDESEEQAFLAIAALGAVAAFSMMGYAAYKAHRECPEAKGHSPMGEWSPEGEYVFPTALRDPTPTREIKLNALRLRSARGRAYVLLTKDEWEANQERIYRARRNIGSGDDIYIIQVKDGYEIMSLTPEADEFVLSLLPSRTNALFSGGADPPRNRKGLTFQEWAARAGWSEAAKKLTGHGFETPEIQWQMGEDPEEVRAENVGDALDIANTLGGASYVDHVTKRLGGGGINAFSSGEKMYLVTLIDRRKVHQEADDQPTALRRATDRFGVSAVTAVKLADNYKEKYLEKAKRALADLIRRKHTLDFDAGWAVFQQHGGDVLTEADRMAAIRELMASSDAKGNFALEGATFRFYPRGSGRKS